MGRLNLTLKPWVRFLIVVRERVGLDWQRFLDRFLASYHMIEALPEQTLGTELRTAELRATIERNASRVRKALEPYILPTIRRKSLLKKCLKEIRFGIKDRCRVVPILGAAGYGKSTILGTIYEELHHELVESGTGWVALARCDDLVESASSFARELGEKVSGFPLSIIEIAKRLTEQRASGVLLLDTLDIILTRPLVPILRGILSQLLEVGTTIVFTCRDQDYRNFFEPYHESFAGFSESVYGGCKISEFNDDEVKEATQAFVKFKLGYTTLESRTSFADKIIKLSADSVSLQEIVRNPLLLALLCELFAESENVPEDLTVSQLYEKYWHWKIVKVRHNSQVLYLKTIKEELCLQIAETLYRKSGERLQDCIYESELSLDEMNFSAYEELKSEGVLRDLGGKRIGFFHQTFLEYAIARWLNSTESGNRTKIRLRESIRTSSFTEAGYYIWPIFRQLLTLITLSEFFQVADELDKSQVLAFRSVALAAVSRIEPKSSSVLLYLLEITNPEDYNFQEILLIAANSAPRWHGETVWELVIRLVEMVGGKLINRAVETVTELLIRLHHTSSIQSERALQAIKNSSFIHNSNKVKDGHHILGMFVASYSEYIKSKGITTELNFLFKLKEYYCFLGSHARSKLIKLYLTSGIPESAQREFLLKIVREPLANKSFLEKQPAILILKQLLPKLLETGDTPFGSSWFEALHSSLAPEWMMVTAIVVGDRAASDPELAEYIIHSLFGKIPSGVSREFNRCNLIAAQESINRGESKSVASILVSLPINSIVKNRVSMLNKLLQTFADEGQEQFPIDPELKLKLFEWVKPIFVQYPAESIGAINALVSQSVYMQNIVGEILEAIIPDLEQIKINQVLKKIAFIPESLESYLCQNSHFKESREALLKLYQKKAEKVDDNFPSVMSKIIQFCLDDSQNVAQKASWIVLDSAERRKPIDVIQLLSVLGNSSVVGVRQNCLSAFIQIVKFGSITLSQSFDVFEILANEKSPEVLQLLYELIRTFIHKKELSEHRDTRLKIAKAAFQLTYSIIEHNDRAVIDMITRNAFITFNQLTLLENTYRDKDIVLQISECSCILLQKVDIGGKLDKQIVSGLFNKLAQYDPKFLEKIVSEDFIKDKQILYIANQEAIVVAIVHSQGKNSPLLDRILNDPRLPEEIKSRIFRERGV